MRDLRQVCADCADVRWGLHQEYQQQYDEQHHPRDARELEIVEVAKKRRRFARFLRLSTRSLRLYFSTLTATKNITTTVYHRDGSLPSSIRSCVNRPTLCTPA